MIKGAKSATRGDLIVDLRLGLWSKYGVWLGHIIKLGFLGAFCEVRDDFLLKNKVLLLKMSVWFIKKI